MIELIRIIITGKVNYLCSECNLHSNTIRFSQDRCEKQIFKFPFAFINNCQYQISHKKNQYSSSSISILNCSSCNFKALNTIISKSHCDISQKNAVLTSKIS